MKIYANQFIEEAIIISDSRMEGELTEILTKEEQLEALKNRMI